MKRKRPNREPDAVVYGIHAVSHFISRFPDRVLKLLVAEERQDQRLSRVTDAAAGLGLKCQVAPREALERLSEGGAHQGVVAMIRPRPMQDESDLIALLDDISEAPFLLILDGVQDPHNLGACLRTADATGVHAVIAPRNRAVGLTPTVRKVACGASETVPFIQVTNLARALRELGERDITRVGTDGDAPDAVFDADLRGRLALVMGGEGRGLRRLTREHCDLLVSLPMRGAVESLNVSVATGVCLYVALAQRRTGGDG